MIKLSKNSRILVSAAACWRDNFRGLQPQLLVTCSAKKSFDQDTSPSSRRLSAVLKNALHGEHA